MRASSTHLDRFQLRHLENKLVYVLTVVDFIGDCDLRPAATQLFPNKSSFASGDDLHDRMITAVRSDSENILGIPVMQQVR